MNDNKLIKAFNLSCVKLTDKYSVNALEKEIDYLLSLDTDKLLCGFRETAGVDVKWAIRYDGWENSLIGGHTMGHYLSAMAQAYANPGVSEADRNKIFSLVCEIIDALIVCQQNSKGKPGFIFGALCPHPENVEFQFDNVEKGRINISTEAWVPWYTMHKILAGILDVYKFCCYEPALTLAKGLGSWVYERTSNLSRETRKTVLSVEFGGMNDVMYELYDITHNDKYAIAAHFFDAKDLYELVLSGASNALNDKHANTTIPKFIGALNRYLTCNGKIINGEIVDASKYLEYAKAFWDMVVERHSYITGANSEWEHFGLDYVLDSERTNANNETCNVYNMLKLSRTLFEITGDVKYADYYENAYINSILSSQNPETGMTTYFQPMANGYFKVFGTRYTKFWCCTGTGIENFTKLGDSNYFYSDTAIYVNNYQSSELNFKEKGIILKMATSLPKSCDISVSVNTSDFKPTSMDILFRLPDWLSGAAIIKINEAPFDYDKKNGYARIPAGISDGTLISLTFPMKVTAFPLPDNKRCISFKYGPIVLSACLGTKDMTTTTTGILVTIPENRVTDCDYIVLPNGSDISSFIEKVDDYFSKEYNDDEIVFKLAKTPYTFKPYYSRYKDRYGIYFIVTTEDEFKKAGSLGYSNDVIIDTVQPGYGQYENDELHSLIDNGSFAQTDNGTRRRALAGGSFTYRMAIAKGGNNYLKLTFLREDNWKRIKITSGDKLIVEKMLNYSGNEESYDFKVKIPDDIISAAKEICANDQHYSVIPITFSGVDGFESANVAGFIYTVDVPL